MECENVFEETPVWSTTQEILAHGHECSEVRDSVGGKVMKLCSKEVQEASEERMGRQRKTAVNMGGEQNTLTLLWSRLGLVLREPHRSMGNQSPLDQIVDVVLPDCRPNTIALDPAER